MSKQKQIQERTNSVRKKSERIEVVRFAKRASKNAKRSSIALDIPYKIIKDGGIYEVRDGNMIKTATIERVKSDNDGITKGSKICLK